MDLTTVDYLLTTTRSVRKRLDLTRPIDLDTLLRCLEIAVQAPTGANLARYHFVIVLDPATRTKLAGLYRRGIIETYLPWRSQQAAPFSEAEERFHESTMHLVEHLHEVPVHVIPCIEGRFEDRPVFYQASRYGCILPAVWSFMLALRARGIASCWTTAHLLHEKEAAALLGIPDDMTQAALIPVAHAVGADFRPARRVPAAERTYWNAWGATKLPGD